MGIFKINFMKLSKIFTISNIILFILFICANAIVAKGSFEKLGHNDYIDNIFAMIAIFISIFIDRFVIEAAIINFKNIINEKDD